MTLHKTAIFCRNTEEIWRHPGERIDYGIFNVTVEQLVDDVLPDAQSLFDLLVTSPPYNIGKSYEKRTDFCSYLKCHRRLLTSFLPLLKPGGSLCYVVGNYVEKGRIFPLSIEFGQMFKELGLELRNMIIWHFGHGLHATKRFSGRYETILWCTKPGIPYTFNLDAVRMPSKYPGKRAYKGPNAGRLSGNPLGKNPSDVWEIPNVVGNHVEKTCHPCQFPVGLAERLVLALSNPGDLVFDPFAGVFSTGVACAVHGRRFWGCEPVEKYAIIGLERIQAALDGKARYRKHDKPVYDHTQSPLSKVVVIAGENLTLIGQSRSDRLAHSLGDATDFSALYSLVDFMRVNPDWLRVYNGRRNPLEVSGEGAHAQDALRCHEASAVREHRRHELRADFAGSCLNFQNIIGRRPV